MKISKLQVAISGLQEALVRLLKEWRPPFLQTELEYRDALYKRLRDSLPEDARIEREYRHSGTTADLYLRWVGVLGIETEVFFELKHNLTKKSQLDRLVGQIRQLNPARHNILVVLTGERDPSLVDRLKDQFAEFVGGNFFGGAWMEIVEVQLGRRVPNNSDQKTFG